jgi:hypothetical protein
MTTMIIFVFIIRCICKFECIFITLQTNKLFINYKTNLLINFCLIIIKLCIFVGLSHCYFLTSLVTVLSPSRLPKYLELPPDESSPDCLVPALLLNINYLLLLSNAWFLGD